MLTDYYVFTKDLEKTGKLNRDSIVTESLATKTLASQRGISSPPQV